MATASRTHIRTLACPILRAQHEPRWRRQFESLRGDRNVPHSATGGRQECLPHHCFDGGPRISGHVFRMLPALLLLVIASCARQPAASPLGADESFLNDHGIRYWLIVRDQPRPLRMHHLRIDLSNPRIELAAGLAADPDGAGPATAALEPPMSIAQRMHAVAMVNANPWQSTLDEKGQRSTNWHEGMAVEALGLSADEGRIRSRPAAGHCEFWVDGRGRAHVGPPPELESVDEGVAGFTQIIGDGKLLPEPGGPIHPRTALGVDAAGRYLYLMVVDGRSTLR